MFFLPSVDVTQELNGMSANVDGHEDREDAGATEEQREDAPMETENDTPTPTFEVTPMFDTVDPHDFLGSVAKVGCLIFVCLSFLSWLCNGSFFEDNV